MSYFVEYDTLFTKKNYSYSCINAIKGNLSVHLFDNDE